MGICFTVTCKQCGYHKDIREGVGMLGFYSNKMTEKDILSGKVKNSAALESLKKGNEIMSGAAYLCPNCKEIVSKNDMYIRENETVSPFGTVRYDVSFPFGQPVCDECSEVLIFIKNVRSSKVKCPKCGGDFKISSIGYFD